jgi:hypothetical protein
MRRELELGQAVPLVHANWMRSNWALMKLRRRSPGLAATAFLNTVRMAHAECVAEDVALEKRWRARLPRLAPATDEAAGERRRKRSD